MTVPSKPWTRNLALMVAALATGFALTAWIATPQFDPFGWLLWGREIWTGHPVFSTVNYPSWKPLGALLAVPVYALTGSAAPVAWLALERAGALLGLVVAFRLGSQLRGRGAGALAVVAIVLLNGWFAEMLNGRLEPLLASLVLAAALFDRQRHEGRAAAALAAVSLARPEALLLLVAYLGLSCRRRRAVPAWAPVLVLLVPAAWLLGDLLGSGSALHGGALARWAAAASRHGAAPSAASSAQAIWHAGIPVVLLGAAGLIAARARDRTIRLMIAATLLWLCEDTAMAALGYPTSTRFLIPALAVAIVAGAVGVVGGVEHLRQARFHRGLVWAAVSIATLVFCAGALPSAMNLDTEADGVARYAADTSALREALEALPPRTVRACNPAVPQPFETPLSWYTDRGMGRLHRAERSSGTILRCRAVYKGRLKAVAAGRPDRGRPSA